VYLYFLVEHSTLGSGCIMQFSLKESEATVVRE